MARPLGRPCDDPDMCRERRRQTLKYQTPDEKWHENEFGGLLARAIQHEMDHLNGVFIVDRVGEVERIQYQAELKALEIIYCDSGTIATDQTNCARPILSY